jgi:hypothetical protein
LLNTRALHRVAATVSQSRPLKTFAEHINKTPYNSKPHLIGYVYQNFSSHHTELNDVTGYVKFPSERWKLFFKTFSLLLLTSTFAIV